MTENDQLFETCRKTPDYDLGPDDLSTIKENKRS